MFAIIKLCKIMYTEPTPEGNVDYIVDKAIVDFFLP